eukprot:5809192-Prymnesium_polylepis.2
MGTLESTAPRSASALIWPCLHTTPRSAAILVQALVFTGNDSHKGAARACNAKNPKRRYTNVRGGWEGGERVMGRVRWARGMCGGSQTLQTGVNASFGLRRSPRLAHTGRRGGVWGRSGFFRPVRRDVEASTRDSPPREGYFDSTGRPQRTRQVRVARTKACSPPLYKAVTGPGSLQREQ